MNTMKMTFGLLLTGLLNTVSTSLLAQDLGIIGPSPYEFNTQGWMQPFAEDGAESGAIASTLSIATARNC